MDTEKFEDAQKRLAENNDPNSYESNRAIIDGICALEGCDEDMVRENVMNTLTKDCPELKNNILFWIGVREGMRLHGSILEGYKSDATKVFEQCLYIAIVFDIIHRLKS